MILSDGINDMGRRLIHTDRNRTIVRYAEKIIDWNSIDNYSIIIGLCYLFVMELVHSGYMKTNNEVEWSKH